MEASTPDGRPEISTEPGVVPYKRNEKDPSESLTPKPRIKDPNPKDRNNLIIIHSIMISYIATSIDGITSTAQPAVDNMHNIMITTIILLDLVLVMRKQAQTVSGTIRTILGIGTSNADRATSGDVKATTLTRGLSLRRRRGVLAKHGSSESSSQRGPLLWGLTPNNYPSSGSRWGGCRWNMRNWRRSIGGRRWRGRLNVADGRKCFPGTSQLLSKTNDQLILSDHIASEVHGRPVTR
jgi:hypothetical protein